MSDLVPKNSSYAGDGLRVLIVASRFNDAWVSQLLEAVIQRLEERGVELEDIKVVRVPGALEVPQGISMVVDAEEDLPHVAIGLGVVIAGDTNHHEVIGNSTSLMLQTIAIDRSMPVINGIIVCNTEAQADQRCGAPMNRGVSFAEAAIEMAGLGLDLFVGDEDE
ncbi:MAG: 6,7-dimethyl-8-ribityllumazine synthase [Puniceicoccaceae bacterium]